MVIAILRRPIASGLSFKLFNVTRVVFVVVHLVNTVAYFIGLGYRTPNSLFSKVVIYNSNEEEIHSVLQTVNENQTQITIESDCSSTSSWYKMIYLELEQLNCEITFIILRGLTMLGANLFGLTGAIFPKVKLFWAAFGFSCISLIFSIMNTAMFPSWFATANMDFDIICLVVGIIMLRETTSYIQYLNEIESGIDELRQSQNEEPTTVLNNFSDKKANNILSTSKLTEEKESTSKSILNQV